MELTIVFFIEPIEVLHTAVNKNARYVILVHNHPGGTLAPSEADEDLTDQLMHAAELVRLRVIEHLIITKDDFFSFCTSGTLAKLEKSKKYAVYFIEEAKLLEEGEQKGFKVGKDEGLKEGIEIGREEGKEDGLKEGKIEMALGMKQKGIDLQMIKEISGLSIEEIEKL
ncbi:MAG: JAB domain-containing protein [Candidatus Marithrix sp.]